MYIYQLWAASLEMKAMKRKQDEENTGKNTAVDIKSTLF